MKLQSILIPPSTHLKMINRARKKFSPKVSWSKIALKRSISCEYKCWICNLMQIVLFTKVSNSLFPGLSPQNVFATEQQKLPALQNHHSFNDNFKKGNPVPRGLLISRNTIIPTGREEESSLILFASTFCFPWALSTSEHITRASLIRISYYSSSKPSGLDCQKWLKLLSAPESRELGISAHLKIIFWKPNHMSRASFDAFLKQWESSYTFMCLWIRFYRKYKELQVHLLP